LIFSTCGYQVLHDADVIAPGNVSNPVLMGWTILFVALKLSLKLEFICGRVFLPYLRFIVHWARHKPFADESVWFFRHWLLALKIIVLG
jgi:hypothetical protein